MIHKYEHRVLPEEVDVFRVVHYSNYLKWCSNALIDFFEHNNLGAGVFDDGNVQIRVGRVNIVYIKSAKFQDRIKVEIIDIVPQRKSMEVKLKIMVEDKLLVRAKITVAFVDSDTSKLVNVPNEIQSLIRVQEEVVNVC